MTEAESSTTDDALPTSMEKMIMPKSPTSTTPPKLGGGPGRGQKGRTAEGRRRGRGIAGEGDVGGEEGGGEGRERE